MSEIIENTELNEDIGLDTGHIDDATVQADTETAIKDNWLDSLPDNLKSSKSLQMFKSVPALANSYLEAQKTISQRIAVPSSDAAEEEWQRFYNKVGRPEDKKYLDERVPEDEEFVKVYEDMFYRNGLNKKQGCQLLKELYKYSSGLQEKQKSEFEEAKNNNINWLKETYGSEYDGKLSLMDAALAKYGSKELAGLIEENGYSPALVDMLVKVGETLKPDTLVVGNETPAITTFEGAKKEIERLEADKEFMVKYRDKSSQGHEEAVSKLEELYKTVYNKQ